MVEGRLGNLEAHWPRPTTAEDCARARDALPTSIENWIRTAKVAIGNLDDWAKRLTGLAVEANRDSVDDRLKAEIQRAIGVDVKHLLYANGPLLQSMKTATVENIDLIKSIPDQYLGRVLNTVTVGWAEGLRWESLIEQIQQDGNVTENRAKLIARDQTSKMNAAFNEERQQQVGIERYEWSTSQDERVRDGHAAMEGQVCEWSNPPTVDDEQVHPGEAVNCRCVALPIVDMEVLGVEAESAQQEPEEQEQAA